MGSFRCFQFNFMPFLFSIWQSNFNWSVLCLAQKKHKQGVPATTVFSFKNRYNIDRRCVTLNNCFILILVFLLSFPHSSYRYLLQWKVWLLSTRLPFRPPHSSLQDPKPGIFRPSSIFIKETPFRHFLFGPR